MDVTLLEHNGGKATLSLELSLVHHTTRRQHCQKPRALMASMLSCSKVRVAIS